MVVSIHLVGLVDQASEAPREGRASIEILKHRRLFVSQKSISYQNSYIKGLGRATIK